MVQVRGGISPEYRDFLPLSIRGKSKVEAFGLGCGRRLSVAVLAGSLLLGMAASAVAQPQQPSQAQATSSIRSQSGSAAAQAAQAGASAEQQLQTFIQQVKSATGRFEQQTRNSGGRMVSRQQGEFAFERPGRFRWAVAEPFEQLIVSDGKQVVQYDPDLAQATLRPVSAAVGNAPAQILFGDGELQQAFALEALPSRENLAWLRATPRSPEAGFTHLEIGMRDGMPAAVEILDAFGQTSRIDFVALVPGPSLPASTFRFQVPSGVDVVQLQ